MQSCDYLESFIPKGLYCYTIESIDETTFRMKTNPCPYWRKFSDEYPEQESGYCTYLKKGDFMEDGTFLLWDQVKECGINDDFNLDEINDQINQYLNIF